MGFFISWIMKNLDNKPLNDMHELIFKTCSVLKLPNIFNPHFISNQNDSFEWACNLKAIAFIILLIYKLIIFSTLFKT